MTHIEQLESEITNKLEAAENTATIARWVSEKVVESYRNGITAGIRHAALVQERKRRLHY